ncbi:TonB-dependent receptor plug domain-containing protein [Granulicella arctica]|uniref:TonB-dependent receptor plug domain-containing protein n=1 Tax=Granulicella arctica TaxID=940613 RepID=UPI0021E00DC0|nr:TonB-dependent receptor [Granulicella arctica]
MRLISVLLVCSLAFTLNLNAAEIIRTKTSDAATPASSTTKASILPIAREIVVAVPRLRPYTTQSTILVETTAPPLSPTSHKITSTLIETAAGAFEDPSRYFQLLPGVISDSDQRNDFLVRGGNPSENLFVIDNIDIHSINHLALADTTGGFVSMIDNAAVQSMTLHTADHDAKFDDRLSAVVEISTIPDESHPAIRHMTEFGIAGVGGMDSRPLGNGNLFISGRQGILNLLTNDIGLNGVPHYTNNLVRADQTLANGDRLWGLSLTGIDSIAIHPDPNDSAETNPIDIHYSGWRNTTGLNYQHLFSAKSFGITTLSNSEQVQTIAQTAQLEASLPIYNEQTHDGDTALKTEYTLEANAHILLSAGATETLHRIDYSILQPAGASNFNPYTATSTIPSATNIRRNFATADDGSYAQVTFTLPANARFTVAARAHHWAFDHNFAFTPKASLTVPLGLTHSFSLGVADYAQLPSFLYLLSFPQNAALAPIRARHYTAAVTLIDRSRLRLTLAAYRKTYRDYPVSIDYPQLSMANIADTFGQAFLMFPMVSRGLGQATGTELSLDLRASSRLMLTGNIAYSRSRFSGLDGILRNGSFDLPLVANVAAVYRAGRGFTASARYTGTSGRPYTPDDLAASYQQNRDVYDLTQINALRSTPYARLDIRLEKATQYRTGTLLWHGGLDNALNRANFYAYQWQPIAGGTAQQNQMPRFPDGGVKYTF